MIAKSVFDYRWIQEIPKGKPVLIIAEGVFMYFTKKEVIELIYKLVKAFHGAEMLVETIPNSFINKVKNRILSKNNTK